LEDQIMNGDAPISWLMFFTLAAGIVVACGFFLSFLRSRHNREIAAVTLQGDGRSRGLEPSGAAPELIGLLAAAFIAMALLTFGYHARQGVATVGTGNGANNLLATPRTDPEAPKPYQPQNPAPDTRAAPTSSSTGAGAESGGHPEQAPK
jgi:hypothetical protein